jgi:hypothetical protein
MDPAQADPQTLAFAQRVKAAVLDDWRAHPATIAVVFDRSVPAVDKTFQALEDALTAINGPPTTTVLPPEPQAGLGKFSVMFVAEKRQVFGALLSFFVSDAAMQDMQARFVAYRRTNHDVCAMAFVSVGVVMDFVAKHTVH